jgi:cell wall-associated NlpC family hydrolase
VDMARQIQATGAGQAGYCWGGGHSSTPCNAKCFDCSGFVSCVLNRLGMLKGSMTTNGFLAWSGATTVPFSARQPGDIAVNTKHMGILVDSGTMLAARCTACGRPGVQTQKLTSAYRIRRVQKAAGGTEQQAQTPSGRSTTAGL